MPSTVVTDDADSGSERCYLRLPHPEVGPKRVDKQQHGRVGRAVQLIVQAGAIVRDEHAHASTSGALATSTLMRGTPQLLRRARSWLDTSAYHGTSICPASDADRQ